MNTLGTHPGFAGSRCVMVSVRVIAGLVEAGLRCLESVVVVVATVGLCTVTESMVDIQSTPDSAVSPTYSGPHAYQSARYEVDVPPMSSLEQFYYAAAACPPSSGLGAAAPGSGGGGVYPAAVLHQGGNKRLRFTDGRLQDDVSSSAAAVGFATSDNHRHHHLLGHQSAQLCNPSPATHGTV